MTTYEFSHIYSPSLWPVWRQICLSETKKKVMYFYSMILPSHFTNLCKILLSKTWPYAMWKPPPWVGFASVFCQFSLVSFLALEVEHTVNSQFLFIASMTFRYTDLCHIPYSIVYFSKLKSSHSEIFTEESSFNNFLFRTNSALFCLFYFLSPFS